MIKRQRSHTGEISGFTLIEAIVAIVITGVVAGMVTVFIKAPVDGYFDTVRRAELTDAADTALRRITRDVHSALPNSLRITSSGACVGFEFLPVVGSGRYRVAQSSAGTGDILDFSTTDSSFDVLAGNSLPTFTGGIYHAVIFNLGILGDNAYAGDNRAQIAAASTANNIVLTSAFKFPFVSPGKRLDVIPNYSVAYGCSGGQLYRSTQAISSITLTCPTAGTVLVNNVGSCSFSYGSGVTQRNGLLTMNLVLTQSGESVQLYDEVHVNNVP